jgi:hypothetical protein
MKDVEIQTSSDINIINLIKNHINVSNLPEISINKITSFETCKCITNDENTYKNDYE